MKTLRSGPIPAGIVPALVIVALVTLGSLPSDARAVEYQFTPLRSAPVPFNQFQFPATINNGGVVAYVVEIPFVFTADLVLDDGVSVTSIDLNAASGLVAVRAAGVKPFINDAGAVAVRVAAHAPQGPASGKIIRINSDASVTTLATYNRDGISGDFSEFERYSMNNAGQVTALVTLNSGLKAIVMLDDSGQTIVDTEDPAVRFNFTRPAINDNGIVAYIAAEPPSAGESVFTGDGISPVQLGLPLSGVMDCGGGSSSDEDINNNGLIVAAFEDCLFAGSGGVVTDVIVDEATNPFTSGWGRLSLNNLDQVVFAASTNNTAGLFFGDDPDNDKLIQGGDALFGETVGNPAVRFDGDGGFNDHGQVVFEVTTVSESNIATSYLVRADRDSDSDGLTDNVDNCTLVANADQRDTDADGIGNSCDADLDGNCVINFSDLGIMKSVFFTADADADLDGNGVVNFTDLGIMKAAFFGPPGPSGVDNLCSDAS